MTSTNLGGGRIYKILASEIERAGYFYGANNGAETLVAAYERLGKEYGRKPDLLLNCELFDFGDRTPSSDVVDEGKKHRLTGSHGLSVVNDTEIRFTYNNWINADDYVGFYPTTNINGKVDYKTPSGIDAYKNRGRTGGGLDAQNNLYIALVPDKKGITLRQLADGMKAAGVVNGGNWDGGLSSQWYSPNGNNYTGRPVRGWFAVWIKKAQAKPAATPSKAPAPAKTAADVRTVKVRVGSCLRVRHLPSTSRGIVVGKLYRGNKVTVLSTEGKWCKIASGWVHSDYLVK